MADVGRRKLWYSIIYIMALAFFITKMVYYSENVSRFPDEICHVSYIAYLDKTNEIIPEFKNMTILTVKDGAPQSSESLSARNGYTETMVFSNSFNYLCHPPLYYQIMRLSGGVVMDSNGEFHVYLLRLRIFSMMLAALAMALIFYIGWSRIGKNAFFHILYAAISVSVPMLAYCCAGVSNDTMSLLSLTVFSFGLLRFSEEKRGYLTYILVGAGCMGCFLSKLTVGIMAAIAAVLFIGYFLIKEKNLKFLITKQFLVTLPFYAVFAAYYIAVRLQTGSFSPNFALLSPQQYQVSGFYTPEKKDTLTSMEYFHQFFSNFLLSWTGIWSHVSLLKKGPPNYDICKIGLLAIVIIPVLIYLWPFFKRQRDPVVPLVGSMYPAVMATVALQFIHQFGEYKKNGYTGGFSSRYYLCAVVGIALACVWVAKMLYSSKKETHYPTDGSRAANRSIAVDIRKIIINLGCLALSAVLVYEDFVYFLMNFKNYMK